MIALYTHKWILSIIAIIFKRTKVQTQDRILFDSTNYSILIFYKLSSDMDVITLSLKFDKPDLREIFRLLHSSILQRRVLTDIPVNLYFIRKLSIGAFLDATWIAYSVYEVRSPHPLCIQNFTKITLEKLEDMVKLTQDCLFLLYVFVLRESDCVRDS